VDEDGNWGPKRKYEYMNGWVPGILVNACCNNDGKLITNGAATRNIAYYISCYAAKNRRKTHQLSAVLADGFAYHTTHARHDIGDLQNQHRLLLYRLVNAINCEQELAAPMVISYLMGWGDVYRTHHYSPVYFSSFRSVLLKVHPEFNLQRNKCELKKLM
jgi:hypothetical protein